MKYIVIFGGPNGAIAINVYKAEDQEHAIQIARRHPILLPDDVFVAAVEVARIGA